MVKSALRALALGFVLVGSGAAPALAQDGIGMRQIFGAIGLLPRVDRDPIEYRDRPALVVPKDRTALRPPEEADAQTKNAAWPVDPDVEERKKEMARRRGPAAGLVSGNDPTEGRRMSMDDIRAGRATRGATIGEPVTMGNDRAGVRLSPNEWAAQQQQASGTSLPPGVEPPRVYLTDPPRGLRQAAAGAPVARTREGPGEGFDNFRPTDTWRRLD